MPSLRWRAGFGKFLPERRQDVIHRTLFVEHVQAFARKRSQGATSGRLVVNGWWYKSSILLVVMQYWVLEANLPSYSWRGIHLYPPSRQTKHMLDQNVTFPPVPYGTWENAYAEMRQHAPRESLEYVLLECHKVNPRLWDVGVTMITTTLNWRYHSWKVRHHLSTFLGNWKIHATRNHGIIPHLRWQTRVPCACPAPCLPR